MTDYFFDAVQVMKKTGRDKHFGMYTTGGQVAWDMWFENGLLREKTIIIGVITTVTF